MRIIPHCDVIHINYSLTVQFILTLDCLDIIKLQYVNISLRKSKGNIIYLTLDLVLNIMKYKRKKSRVQLFYIINVTL